ncbi:MAG: phosphate ABC transporter permease subunit PstC [Bacteroidetes bacterium]|nr:phosphate ABC transporter permease subunit PstC [Bacteroidota bacterium]
MFVCAALIILLPLLIGLGLYLKSGGLLSSVPLYEVLFSGEWQPWEGKFGLLPFILSSLWVTILALVIAAPVCLLCAIYLTQYARARLLNFMQPIIDILAGIPSVIYGVWGILVIVPLTGDYLAPFFGGAQNSGYCILSGGIVLAIMIIPFILNILIEIFRAIPKELTEASLSLGATQWETIKYVLLRKARPGIVSSFGLGLSRAFGETIAVLMVAGNVAKTPSGVFQAGYPLPALIANNYGEMLSIPMYDSALMFAALVLFVIVLVFNFLSRVLIVKLERNI